METTLWQYNTILVNKYIIGYIIYTILLGPKSCIDEEEKELRRMRRRMRNLGDTHNTPHAKKRLKRETKYK